MPVHMTVSEVLKRGIFHILRFVWYVDEGATAPIASSVGYATDHSTIQALNLVCIVLLCHKPKVTKQVRHPAVLHDTTAEKYICLLLI